jgi:hypothetical protein
MWCCAYGLARRSGKARSWILDGLVNFMSYNPFNSSGFLEDMGNENGLGNGRGVGKVLTVRLPQKIWQNIMVSQGWPANQLA